MLSEDLTFKLLLSCKSRFEYRFETGMECKLTVFFTFNVGDGLYLLLLFKPCRWHFLRLMLLVWLSVELGRVEDEVLVLNLDSTSFTDSYSKSLNRLTLFLFSLLNSRYEDKFDFSMLS